MAGSYREINYSLRPAKSSERKMLVEAMRRLSVFDKIENYGYIGFGSAYFSDFSLFHRLLGINDMISIEKEVDNSERFIFNKPFACIDIKFGLSEYVLPELSWANKKIVWLDYDDPLNSTMLIDLNTFMTSAKPGSMFIISFNAQPASAQGEPDEIKKVRLDELEKRIGTTRVPVGTDGSDLSLGKLPKVYHKIVSDEIDEALSYKNIGLHGENKLLFKQLFNFIYKDGAQMQTIGGMLLNNEQLSQFKNANFQDLNFVRDEDSFFKIDVPNLTFREISHLDSKLHSECSMETGEVKPRSELLSTGIPPSDIRKYVNIYRYFPTFAEALF